MALIYIIGSPGAGKTTLEKELKSRGFETHDMDDSDIGGAHNKVTGERVTIPSAKNRPKEWFDAHEWRTSKPAIEKLKLKAKRKTILLCGVASDDAEVLSIFDKVIYLNVDEETLKQRIAGRKDNDYGKNDFELAEILERRQAIDAKYKGMGVTSIDGSQEVKVIADAIVAEATREQV
jgi:shikimate kinase